MTDTPAKPVVAGMSAREVIADGLFRYSGGVGRVPLWEPYADAALSALASAGYAVVPVEPTEAMWVGLARQIVLWRDMNSPTGAALYQHLTASGYEIPDWLRKEIPDTNHVPAKGDVAVCIYRAMLAASRENSASSPIEQVREALRDVETGEPLYDDARVDITAGELRAALDQIAADEGAKVVAWLRTNPTIVVEREWFANGKVHGGVHNAIADAISRLDHHEDQDDAV